MKRNALLLILVVMAVVAWSMPTMAQDAAGLYKAKCAMCHGPDGKGETPMGKKLAIRDLGSSDVQKEADAALNTIITKGKDKMPAFGGKLTPEQIGQLVTQIREFGKKK